MTRSARVAGPAARGAAVAALALGAVAAAPAAASAASEEDAVAVATYGDATAWLEREGDDRRQVALHFRARKGADPVEVDVDLPGLRHRVSTSAPGLALGLDAGGELTAVVQSAEGLHHTAVSGTPRLRKVPGTGRRDAEPSLFRGAVAYTHDERTVRVGTLTRRFTRTAWRADDPNVFPFETAIGRSGAVVVVTATDGAGEGTYEALLSRPGSAVRRLARLPLGDDHRGYLVVDRVAASGRRVTITRVRDGVVTPLRFELPTGRRVKG